MGNRSGGLSANSDPIHRVRRSFPKRIRGREKAVPAIAWSKLNVPKAAISDTVLLCHAGLGEKFPIFLLRAIACARAPKAEMTSVATMIQMTFCPDRVSTTADPRAAARELIE